ncbi:MAG: YkvA family protein [bacterium]
MPFHLKALLIIAVVYLISPLDLLPDFLIPIVGSLDDFIILWFALRFFFKRCPREVLLEHVRRIEAES